MNAGDLRHFVQLQRPVETQDAEGGTVRDWETVRSVWAQVRALSGQEFWAASAVQANVQYRVRFRALDVVDLDASWRIRLEDGRVLGIAAKLRDDTDRGSVLVLCGENTT